MKNLQNSIKSHIFNATQRNATQRNATQRNAHNYTCINQAFKPLNNILSLCGRNENFCPQGDFVFLNF